MERRLFHLAKNYKDTEPTSEIIEQIVELAKQLNIEENENFIYLRIMLKEFEPSDNFTKQTYLKAFKQTCNYIEKSFAPLEFELNKITNSFYNNQIGALEAGISLYRLLKNTDLIEAEKLRFLPFLADDLSGLSIDSTDYHLKSPELIKKKISERELMETAYNNDIREACDYITNLLQYTE